MIGLIAQGGFLLIPILLLSLAAVFLIVERALYYWQVREPERDLAGSVLGALPITAPAELAATLGNKISPEAQVIRAALSSAGGIARPEQRRTLDSVVVREITALERNVPYLQSIANVATLLGLLGTVLGMIVSFVNLRAAGSADLTVLSGGIAQALITTAAGLTVAIPSTLFHHLFSHHVHRTVARLNLIVSELAAKLGDGRSMSDDYRHYHSSLTTGGPLPLTPLIDMVFLIVIFFMINAAFAMHSVIPVELPGATTGAVPGATELIITVAADGRIYLDRDGAANAVSLNDLHSVLTGARDLPVVLRGDARAAYGGLVAVMDAARAAGITNLSLVTVAAPAGS